MNFVITSASTVRAGSRGVVFAKRCEFLLVFLLGEGLGGGFSWAVGVGCPLENERKGEGVGRRLENYQYQY